MRWHICNYHCEEYDASKVWKKKCSFTLYLHFSLDLPVITLQIESVLYTPIISIYVGGVSAVCIINVMIFNRTIGQKYMNIHVSNKE